MRPEQFEELLHEDESTALDFKQKQYEFEKADDKVKGELLKDILALANAWRRTEACLVIGVKEVKGRRADVIGLSNHIDDATLQQFVNSKTNKRLEFSYEALEFDGKPVAVIRIPLQERPFVLKRDFGKLKKDVVYIRQGSSTGTADVSEVTEMVKADLQQVPVPSVLVEFHDSEHDRDLGRRIRVQTLNLSVSDGVGAIPDFVPRPVSWLRSFSVPMASQPANEHYLREAYEYARFQNAHVWLRLSVSNGGIVPLTDITLLMDGISPDFLCASEADMPNKPSKRRPIASLSASVSRILSGSRWGSMPRVESPDVSCRNVVGGTWSLRFHINKVQPGMRQLTEPLLVGASLAVEQHCEIVVAADELPSPVTQECFISVDPRTLTMSGEKIASTLRKWDLVTPVWNPDGGSIESL